jgi:hypothetical protein
MSGNKKDNITVIYTPWSNLKKDGSMAVGQVGFKENKKVSRHHFPFRNLTFFRDRSKKFTLLNVKIP